MGCFEPCLIKVDLPIGPGRRPNRQVGLLALRGMVVEAAPTKSFENDLFVFRLCGLFA